MTDERFAATFRAGISMSGTALSPWAFRPPSEVTHLADRVAALAGCPRESLALVHCLREKRAEELVDILHKYKVTFILTRQANRTLVVSDARLVHAK